MSSTQPSAPSTESPKQSITTNQTVIIVVSVLMVVLIVLFMFIYNKPKMVRRTLRRTT
jgi:hypothetical protein